MKAKDEIKRLLAALASGDIHPDEPLFSLRGRDSLAAETVRFWSKTALRAGALPVKCAVALATARTMDAWPVKQIPGMDETRVGTLPPITETNDGKSREVEEEAEVAGNGAGESRRSQTPVAASNGHSQ